MKISINKKTYNDSSWSFDHASGIAALILSTDETIAEVASTFNGDDTIHAYNDNDVETGTWYVYQVTAVYERDKNEGSRAIIVNMKASALSTVAEEELGESIEENTEAIIELGGLIADMDDANIRINNIEGVLEGIPKDITIHFGEIETLYNALADRVAQLENANQ